MTYDLEEGEGHNRALWIGSVLRLSLASTCLEAFLASHCHPQESTSTCSPLLFFFSPPHSVVLAGLELTA